MVDAEFVPLSPTYLSFWEKMKELQYKMLSFDQENIPDHMFACESPLDWLFLVKGIAYWIDPNSNVRRSQHRILFREIISTSFFFLGSNLLDWKPIPMVWLTFVDRYLHSTRNFLSFTEKKEIL